jgi:heme oxygenase (mycobilin-producing)
MRENIMTVKIFIKRDVQEKNIADLTLLLKKLRGLTLSQPGYISGETLRRIDKPNESMVISTWRSVEDWNKWVNNDQRLRIQTEIDQLLGQETEYAVYE